MSQPKPAKLSAEEQQLLESLEAGEWESVPRLRDSLQEHRQYAKNTLRKDRRVNIRISSRDLQQLQTLAVENGIPYQTLMSSILHRFVSGKLLDSER